MIEIIGGPDRDRTDDLFHAMEARSQLRHRPTLGGLIYFRLHMPPRQTAPCSAYVTCTKFPPTLFAE
jgi:hypothetical protein